MLRSLLLLCALGSSGCFTTSYLLQAAGGEYELLHVARPISKVVADPKVPRKIRRLLSQVEGIKNFGRAHGLKATPNYTRYSDLHRSAAVYVVQACAPLSFDVRHWSFPIVGTVPYLGFFNEAAAREYAARLGSQEQLDIAVRTAAAFSTLGWFRDPVLSTMISDDDDALSELANTILHESVHATVYLPNQSSFNESLASYVADGLTRTLLTETFGATFARDYDAGQKRIERRLTRLHGVYGQLDALYRSDRSDAEKTAEKATILLELQKELRLRQPLNNANLAGFQTYASGTGGFDRLHKACGDWPQLLEAVKTLEPSDFDQAQQEALDPLLDRLAARACPMTAAQK